MLLQTSRMPQSAPQKRLEELLTRLDNPVALPVEEPDPIVDEALSYLKDKRVLVTGAGGSIGTQLCLSLTRIGVGNIIALGHGGGSLLKLSQKLNPFPHTLVVADVADPIQMKAAFQRFEPEVVFHLAAIKHLDVLEVNEIAAVTNVKGTQNVVSAALEHDIELLVFVSTDKACNPTSIYGCSKRVGEMIVISHADNPVTKMVIVRFGNCFGSSASVVELFLRQIDVGGPVTVTHPQVSRWFMGIDEAAMLICHAGALGHGGEIFVLDMGEPIRIVDLARTLIERSGRKDIKIAYCGLRPGEKLYEALFTAEELKRRMPTQNSRIWKVKPEKIDRVQLGGLIAELVFFAEEGHREAVKKTFQELIPEYVPDYMEKAA